MADRGRDKKKKNRRKKNGEERERVGMLSERREGKEVVLLFSLDTGLTVEEKEGGYKSQARVNTQEEHRFFAPFC